MTIAWVVGRGGMLGSSIERVLGLTGCTMYVPNRRFDWTSATQLQADFEHALDGFANAAAASDRWEIWWAAGVGTLSSPAEALQTETQALAALLLGIERSSLRPPTGRIALASSAGAIYAGSEDRVITERSGQSPTTPYARAKLEQESLVMEHGSKFGSGVFVARLSTLYGVGQAKMKQQGLLTHISRCVIRNLPIQIFVPLDTIRDYVAADDAAAMMVDAMTLVAARQSVMKIIASEQPTTISEIVSIFKRIARRPPRIVTSASRSSSLYKRRIQFRSVVSPLRTSAPTNLMIGISRILESERLRYVVGERKEW